MNTTLMAGKFGVLALFVPVAMGMLFGLVASGLGLLRRNRIARWVPVRATVLSLDMETSTYKGTFWRTTEAYDLIVRYGYEFGGAEYEASLSLEIDVPKAGGKALPEHLDEAYARDRARFDSGEIEVRVNPDDPTISALHAESATKVWLFFFGFLVGTVAFGGFTVALLLS